MDVHDHPVDASPLKFQEAIDAFLKLVPMTTDEYATLDATEQDFAFVLANVAEADVVAQVYDQLQSAIEDGTDFDTFRANVQDALEESWGGEEPGRIETIFRTAVMDSYNEGRHERRTSPTVMAARPYGRYDGIDDGRACGICHPIDGVILLLSHEWWQRHYPILHCNCRDVETPLTKEEAEQAGITGSPPESDEPQEGFGVPPSGATDIGDFDPDAEEYDGGIGDVLDDKLDDGDGE